MTWIFLLLTVLGVIAAVFLLTAFWRIVFRANVIAKAKRRGELDAERERFGGSNTVLCRFCGAPISADSDFCPECGRSQR